MVEVGFKPLMPFINKGHWWEREGIAWDWAVSEGLGVTRAEEGEGRGEVQSWR